MSTQNLWSSVGRLVAGIVCVVATASCGSEMLRTGRSPMYLVVDGIGGGTSGTDAFILSDVLVNGSIVNDSVTVRLSSAAKDATATLAAINAITLTRYHVDFRRADGRERPGIDVPYGFDGGLSVTINPNGTGNATFVLVRHQAKEEPPLRNLQSQGGLGIIQTIAEITLYGHDQNGNEVAVVARIDVHFGDFADS
jgi:hypothetical protein